MCAFLGVWVPVCVHMPRALSMGLGGAGAHLALPGAAVGSHAGGSQRLQAPSRCWEAQGGSSAVLQTEASLRNADSHFRGRFAEELSAPLQSCKEASGFCREPVTSRPPPGSLEGLSHLPGQLRNTAGAFWRALVNMCTWMWILWGRVGA